MKSINEIASLAGCSTATVSRALNGSGQVCDETRKAIMKVVSDCKYVPRRRHSRASSPSSAPAMKSVELAFCLEPIVESFDIGGGNMNVEAVNALPPSVIFSKPNKHGDFYRMISEGAMEEGEALGMKVSMRTIDSLEGAKAESLLKTEADGIVLAGIYMAGLDAFTSSCRKPLVLADIMNSSSAPQITTDNLDGIFQAFEHLKGLGHRKIGFLRGPSNFAYDERLTAYLCKMAENGFARRDAWIYEGPNHLLDAARWCGELFRSGAELPSSFICANDYLALGVMRAAAEAGLSVPGDISVIGFDDIEMAEMATPPLSSVKVSIKEIGRESLRQMDLLLREPGAAPAKRIRLLPSLSARKSTARPNS